MVIKCQTAINLKGEDERKDVRRKDREHVREEEKWGGWRNNRRSNILWQAADLQKYPKHQIPQSDYGIIHAVYKYKTTKKLFDTDLYWDHFYLFKWCGSNRTLMIRLLIHMAANWFQLIYYIPYYNMTCTSIFFSKQTDKMMSGTNFKLWLSSGSWLSLIESLTECKLRMKQRSKTRNKQTGNKNVKNSQNK